MSEKDELADNAAQRDPAETLPQDSPDPLVSETANPDPSPLSVEGRARRKALRKAKREASRAKGEQKDRNRLNTVRRTLRRGTQFLFSWLGSGPVSVGLALALVAFFLIRSLVGSESLTWNVVAGFQHPWWTVLSYPLWTATAIHMVVDVVLLLWIGIWFERALTSKWYAITGFGSAWVGAALSMLAARVISGFDHQWAAELSTQYVSGTTAFLVGVALAASVKLGGLWRRRIQIMVPVILVVAVGFSGSLDSLSTLISALIGWGLGALLWGKQSSSAQLTGMKSEGRLLVALVVAAVSIGTLLALRSTDMVGALANMRGDLLLSVDDDQVALICDEDGLGSQCAYLSYMLRSSGLASRLLTVMPVVMQLLLAWGLKGGRRAAFWGTLAIQGMNAGLAFAHYWIVASHVHGWDAVSEALGFNELGQPTARFVIPIVVPLLLIALVAGTKRLFTIRAAPGTYRWFWTLVGASLLVGMGAFVVLGLMARNTFTPTATFFGLVGDYVLRVLPAPALYLATPQFQSDSGLLTSVGDWLALLPWLFGAVLLLLSFQRRALPQAISRRRYKEIVRETNAGTMAWMSTWDGNSFWGSPTREAAVAYRASGGVGLTVTDPAAKPEDLEATMKEFAEYCAYEDLIPAFYSVHPRCAEITDSWGWPRLQVAEETILQLPELAFKGKAFQDVRTALNRATKEGISTLWTNWEECPEKLRSQVVTMSEEWAADKSLPEMGFTLGGLAELDDPEVRLLIAVGEDGYLHGATSWMPVYDEGDVIGWTLDFMRRRKDGFRPVMEYMIAQAALWAQEENYEILSLSGAPLAKAAPAKGAEVVVEEGSSSAALDLILEILGKGLEPVYGFRSLLHFKAKFKPKYEPVYLCLPTVTSLPTVGLAIGHAYLPTFSVRDSRALVKAMRGKA